MILISLHVNDEGRVQSPGVFAQRLSNSSRAVFTGLSTSLGSLMIRACTTLPDEPCIVIDGDSTEHTITFAPLSQRRFLIHHRELMEIPKQGKRWRPRRESESRSFHAQVTEINESERKHTQEKQCAGTKDRKHRRLRAGSSMSKLTPIATQDKGDEGPSSSSFIHTFERMWGRSSPGVEHVPHVLI